jgi:molybdopterin converting factor subunit 1
MDVRVLFFASLREKVKTAEIRQTIADGATVGDLWTSLCREHAVLEPMTASVSFAVNREYATRDVVLENDDEVALIPPVSGGH